MLAKSRSKQRRKPDEGHMALVGRAGSRMQDQRARETREAIARGARSVIDAASKLDPHELLPSTPEQLATVEGSAVERTLGVVPGSVRSTRDGSATVFVLAGERVEYDEKGNRL